MVRTRLVSSAALHAVILASFLSVSPAFADEAYSITIKDHKFSPEELRVPTGKKVKLIIKNEDATPEEFESYSLKREKVVGGNSQITVFVGPLKAGSYEYVGEFNSKTAKGRIVAGENT